jgi:hypothetical protein
MKFSPLGAPRLGESAGQNLSLIVCWTVNFTEECACFFVAVKKLAEVSKAGPVVDTSTNIFVSVENFRLEFFGEASTCTARHGLSSTAQVNLA